MSGWIRMLGVVLVAVMPGGLLMLALVLLYRAVGQALREARARAGNGPVPLRAVWAQVQLRAVLREVRHAWNPETRVG